MPLDKYKIDAFKHVEVVSVFRYSYLKVQNWNDDGSFWTIQTQKNQRNLESQMIFFELMDTPIIPGINASTINRC